MIMTIVMLTEFKAMTVATTHARPCVRAYVRCIYARRHQPYDV